MKKGKIEIDTQGTFAQDWEDVLTLLYRPLISDRSFTLYHLLRAMRGKTLDMEEMLRLCGFSEKRLESARQTLEEFRLLKTYQKAASREYLVVLFPPLEAYDFLKDNTFGRLFVAQMGSKSYDALKLHFASRNIDTQGMVEITKPFDSARLQNWNDDQEAIMASLRPGEKTGGFERSFDFETFFVQMDRVFPPRFRTRKNLDLIASLASIYGIGAEEMKKYVNRACNPYTHAFSPEKLERLVHATLKKTVAAPEDPYQMDPMHFFQMRQSAPMARADESLIRDLSEKYGFSNEVVNLLVEYLLDVTGQKFQRAYVEKVAAAWNRLKITTREQAQKQIEAERSGMNAAKAPGVSTGLPEWYDYKPNTPVSEELLAKALARQKKAAGK